jgi:hypothetical protein
MNERILELAKLAGIKSTAELSVSAAEQRFAELIVRQCAEICLEANDHDNILRYFGVKE